MDSCRSGDDGSSVPANGSSQHVIDEEMCLIVAAKLSAACSPHRFPSPCPSLLPRDESFPTMTPLTPSLGLPRTNPLKTANKGLRAKTMQRELARLSTQASRPSDRRAGRNASSDYFSWARASRVRQDHCLLFIYL